MSKSKPLTGSYHDTIFLDNVNKFYLVILGTMKD